jgi:hypothetical protein
MIEANDLTKKYGDKTATVTVGGEAHRKHAKPLQVVGALLEVRAVHTSRSAYNHLLALAATHGIAKSRVGAQIGDRARDLNISLHGLAPKKASLEEAFMEMTRDEVECHAHTPTGHHVRSAS